MSTSPYSLDLRRKVIKYIEQGNSQVSAAKLFDLNLSTVSRWHLRYKKEGHYNPRKRLGAKAKIDPKALELHVNSNPDSTLQDLAKKFGISLWGVNYWLKKLGFSFKKNLLLFGSKRRKTTRIS